MPEHPITERIQDVTESFPKLRVVGFEPRFPLQGASADVRREPTEEPYPTFHVEPALFICR